MQNEPTILTITQAAEFLKVSPDTLRRWEAKGMVTPARTKGGSRRYTLLDLKIAKLNKKKTRLSQITSLLQQNYTDHRRDLKIAMFTSFLWIFGLLTFNFLTPVFLRPTNPEQQIISEELKEQVRLKIASETTPNVMRSIKVSLPDQTPVADKITPSAISQVSDLLMGQFSDLPKLEYTETLDSYYSLQPLPQNQIPTLIKRT